MKNKHSHTSCQHKISSQHYRKIQEATALNIDGFFSTTMKKVVFDKPIEMPDNEYTFLMISWVRIKT